MRTTFWTKRFLLIAGSVFLILAAVNLIKGEEMLPALCDSGIWAVITSTIVVVTRIYRSGLRQACVICRDLPDES
jgi:hypothetical protein